MSNTKRTTTQKNAYYKSKAKESFKTKMNLFIFSLAINQEESFLIDEFNSFEIREPIINKYVAEYWQMEEVKKINGLNYKEIYQKINQIKDNFKNQIIECESEYLNNFENVYPREKFDQLIVIEECSYCGITLNEIENLGSNLKLYKKNFRGWNLEIDRKAPNLEYKPENCTMACYWCNNAKTDEFSFKEFILIGQTIKKIWEERRNDCR